MRYDSTIRLTAIVSAVGLAGLLTGCGMMGTQKTADVMTAQQQQAMTPAAVLADLKAGNERYVRGESTHYNWMSQAEATASGQYPKAIVLSCLDSRVLPETIFDQGIGDIFVGRVAGNFENQDQLGSMEFGSKVAGAKLIVVLGHTSCGAVKGAIDQAELGNLTAMLENIEPAIDAVEVGTQGRTSKDSDFVNRVVEANVRQTISDIKRRSDVIADMVRSGDLMVVGGVYDLETGRVSWLEM
jgi:carbonic anhydrase